MQKKESMHFLWSDAWLLFSIALTDTGEGSTLVSIISAGDYINHSILSGPEIRHGLELFTQAGYVVEMDGRFAISGGAKAFWVDYRTMQKSLYQALDGFVKFLKIVPGLWEEDNSNEYYDKTQYPKLTDEMVLQAYIDYSGIHGKNSRNC